MGVIALLPKSHNSVTDTSWVCLNLSAQAEAAESSAGSHLSRVGDREFRGEAMAFLQADAFRISVLHSGEMASVVWQRNSAQGPCGCPCCSLPKATNLNLSSQDSSLLGPPSGGAQGEWLRREFCALTISQGTCLSGLCLSLTDSL